MSLGLGDFDKNSVHNLTTSTIQSPTNRDRISASPKTSEGFPFPTDFSELDSSDGTFIPDDNALEAIITATIANLTEVEKDKALRAYYRQQLRSETVEQQLSERKSKMLNKARMQEWIKYLLIFVSGLLLISLIAIVATIVYTSLNSGAMTEAGIIPAIVTFFTEIVKVLLAS